MSNWPDMAGEEPPEGETGFRGPPRAARLPQFDVRLAAPDLSRWLPGNTGLRGVIQIESGRSGPHVALTALMHGNEIAGAIVLDELLRADFRPRCGRLSVGFLNLAAFARFDAAQPTASRFVDEDMNRLWDSSILGSGRDSIELARARELRSLFDEVDILVDLHSMLWPSEPLILSGPTEKGRSFARTLGVPSMVVSDHGHSSGPRLIDYSLFANEADGRVACLIEAGPHWEPSTVETARATVRSVLRGTGMAEPDRVPPPDAPQAWATQAGAPQAGATQAWATQAWATQAGAPQPGAPIRSAEVTRVVTAATGSFNFTQAFRGGEIIPARDTLIGHDGADEIRTPYDDCLLVMPSLRPSRGHTAVRLARLLPDCP